jgi:hypothetical protein
VKKLGHPSYEGLQERLCPPTENAMSRHIATAFAAVAVATILVTGAGAGSTSAPGQLAPVNVAPPSISGTTQVGSSLTAAVGQWDGKSLKYAYQWLRCDSGGASCSAIAGATSSTASLSSADLSATLRVLVTATNRNGSAASTSAATAVVASASVQPPPPPPPPPAPAPTDTSPSTTSPPTISGTPQQGQTLSASTGSWSGTTPLSYAYQWQRCNSSGASCVPVAGATSNSFLLGSVDVGSTMRVSLTASNSAGSATASSAATDVVAALTNLPVSNLTTCGGLTSGEAACSSGAYWARTFESPEALAPIYPSCCGTYWNQTTLTPGASATTVLDPTNTASGNHVFRAHVEDSSDYGDWSSLTQNKYETHATQGKDTWLRFRIYFPTDFKAAGYRAGQGNNEFNWVHEYMDTPGFTQYCPSEMGANVALGVLDSNLYSSYVWRVQIYAGQQSSTSNCVGSVGDRDVDGPAIQLGHWYSMVEHVHWSWDSDGLYELWIDGNSAFNIGGPTLYRHPNGLIGEDYMYLFNYRWGGTSTVPTTWPSNVFFDDVVDGSTRLSVGA